MTREIIKFDKMVATLEKYKIVHAWEFPTEKFQVELSPLDEDEIEYYQQVSAKYRNLKPEDEVLLLRVLSQGRETDIVTNPQEVTNMIDGSIQDLLEKEMYEQCAILKRVKDTYLERYKK